MVKTNDRFSPVENNVHSLMEKSNGKSLIYNVVGDNPQWLLIAGIHGDEGGVIACLENVLGTLRVHDQKDGGSSVQILRANPPALSRGTRRVRGIDLNREFKEEISYTQARLLAGVVDKFPNLKYLFSFHEDPEGTREIKLKNHTVKKVPVGFYMYDTPYKNSLNREQKVVNTLVSKLVKQLKRSGFDVFTGIDDSEDPSLGSWIEDGYCQTPALAKHDGSFETYLVKPGKKEKVCVRRSFVFEIPGKIAFKKKQQAVKMVFNFFIIPFLQSSAVRNILT